MTLSSHEQLLLELINRTRLDPEAEATRLGIDLNDGLSVNPLDGSARQVLAANEMLEQAALDHSLWMIETQTFSHTGEGGSAPWSRAIAAGFNGPAGENLALNWTNQWPDPVAQIPILHNALFLSSGHRRNLLNQNYREVGLAYESGAWTEEDDTWITHAGLVTELFGYLPEPQTFLTGVAYADLDGDGFYSVGEGVQGVRFAVAEQTAFSQIAGGYALLVAGQTGAIVSGNYAGGTFNVTLNLSAGNVKLDLVGNNWLHTSGEMVLIDGMSNARLLGVGALSLTGNGEANHLIGNRGANFLSGQADSDTLDGGAGADTLEGGSGDDLFVVDSYGDVVTELANQGTDTIRTSLSSYSIFGQTLIENLTGTRATGHVLTGNGLANVITGHMGDDRLVGGAGNDTLQGSAGKDTLDGGSGSNSLAGGSGDDTYVVSSFADTLSEAAGAGIDTVQTALGAYSIFTKANIENITSTTSASVTLTGNSLNNVLTGNSGNDTLVASSGNDTLLGLGGNDRLDGGAGQDVMIGGQGNDTYLVDSFSDVVTEQAGGGTDTIVTSTVAYSIFARTHIENLTGTHGQGTTLTGNSAANRITAGQGHDSLLGGAGHDTLDGGANSDTLNGGSGADVFQFSAAIGGGTLDHIRDFDPAEDMIHLLASVFAGIGPKGGLAAAAFHIGTAASTAAHRVIYNAATGDLFHDADGAGGAGQIRFARLDGLPGLTAADLLVI